MKLKHLLLSLAVMAALAGCNRGERAAVTGAYGSGVLSGQVVMVTGQSPSGVEVSVRGTGMSTVLGSDGAFTFAGVPDDASLDFRRTADGVQASLKLDNPTGHVVVELAQTNASRSSRRRGVGRGAKVYEFEGVIRSVTAESLVLFTSKKVEETIALKPETVIRKGGTILTAADLLVDQRVHVKAQKIEEAYSAVLVLVQRSGSDDGEDDDESDDDRPAKQEHEGIVISSDAAQLVIFNSHKLEVTFILTPETIIRKGNTPVLATDIQPGWRVHVKATAAEDGTVTANEVIVQNDRNDDDDEGDDDEEGDEVTVSGKVTVVGASGLTVEGEDGPVVVQTDSATRITKKRASISLSDIQLGDRVKVEGSVVAPGVVLAEEIEVKSR